MKNLLAAIGVLAMLAGTVLAVIMIWDKYTACKAECEEAEEDAELEEAIEVEESVTEE